MAKVFPKLPKLDGIEKAINAIKKNRKQQPSDRLVQIISEYGHDEISMEDAIQIQQDFSLKK